MPYMTYSQLINSAKTRIAPVTGKLIAITAIQAGLTLIIEQTSSLPTFFMESFALQMGLSFLLTIVCGTLTGLLEAGFCYVLLKLYCGRPISIGDLFYTFTRQTKTCLGLSFVMSLVSTIPAIPALIFARQFIMAVENMNLDAVSSNIDASAFTVTPEVMNLISLTMFCFTPALIIVTMLRIIYSQAYYLMLDFPAYSVRELLRKSRRLMYGHKGRFFYIQVCFLPIILLGVITCGIGMLWIIPFIYAVQTEFYLDLVTKRKIKDSTPDIKK